MNNILPDELITIKILLIRDQKVILDKDLAQLFGVKTKALKQAVRRNIERFPEDFMLTLSVDEVERMVSQFVTPSKSSLGWALPMAFTEHWILMLSNVLKSKTALHVSIQIIRVFNKMRKMIETNELLYQKLNELESHLSEHDEAINELRFTIKQMMLEDEEPKRMIWFQI